MGEKLEVKEVFKTQKEKTTNPDIVWNGVADEMPTRFTNKYKT